MTQAVFVKIGPRAWCWNEKTDQGCCLRSCCNTKVYHNTELEDEEEKTITIKNIFIP